MRFFSLLFANVMILGLVSSIALAEMSAITVPAAVVGFDEKTVTVRVNEKKVTVPREMVGARKIKTGEAILLTFRGKQISYLLDGEISEGRSPASEKRK